jgi:colanic acid/amylovoran biosynthesis glycosyltransferase
MLGGMFRCAPSLVVRPDFVLYDDKMRLVKRRQSIFWHTGRNREVREKLRAVDLVHAHFATDGAVILPSAMTTNTPLVVTCHGVDATADPRGREDVLVRRWDKLVRYTARFICVSEFIADMLMARGVPTRKIVVHYTGIPLPPIASNVVERRSFLFVGRLVEKKGCADLLKAVASLPEEIRRTEVRIVGDGPLKMDLERLADDLQLRVRFLGIQPPELVLKEMRRARVLCMPSRRAPNGDAEGFGMVLLEAGACGLPVVAYRSGGIPEGIIDEVTGVLVPEGDVCAFASALHRLEDPVLLDDLGRQARAHVERNFDLVRQAERLEEIYDACGSF